MHKLRICNDGLAMALAEAVIDNDVIACFDYYSGDDNEM